MLPKKRKFSLTVRAADVWIAVQLPELQLYLQRSPRFVRLNLPLDMDVQTFVESHHGAAASPLADPEGPCGVVEKPDGYFNFFGWWRPGQVRHERPERHRTSISDLAGLFDEEPETVPEEETEEEPEEEAE